VANEVGIENLENFFFNPEKKMPENQVDTK
jgi:hypothetical protein